MKIAGHTLSKNETLIAWGVIGILLYFVYRWVKAKSARISGEASIDKGINDGLTAGEALSYEETQYVSWANQLEGAMDGSGTDEKTIYNIMRKMQHTTDLLYLIKKFGHRDKKNLFGMTKGNYDLAQWISDELASGEEMDKLNNILLDKDIKFQF